MLFSKKQNDFISESLEGSSFESFKLAGDASPRQYFRIQPSQKKTSYVLMLRDLFTNPQTDPFLNIQSFFEEQGISVPKVIAIRPSQGLVLLEDLGDVTLEQFFLQRKKDDSIRNYKLAIHELIKIHSLPSNNSCLAFQSSFNTEKFLYAMNFTKEHLIEKLIQFSISKSLEKGLQEEFLDICSQINELPKVTCHKDFHSRNIMIHKSKPCIIDFQDAQQGPFEYDLVSLLEDSYVGLNKSDKKELQIYYLEKTGRTQSEEFLKNYQLLSLQRGFKACGSFASFFNNKNDHKYLKYIPRALKFVRSQITNKQPCFKSLLDDSGALVINYTKLYESNTLSDPFKKDDKQL